MEKLTKMQLAASAVGSLNSTSKWPFLLVSGGRRPPILKVTSLELEVIAIAGTEPIRGLSRIRPEHKTQYWER